MLHNLLRWIELPHKNNFIIVITGSVYTCANLTMLWNPSTMLCNFMVLCTQLLLVVIATSCFWHCLCPFAHSPFTFSMFTAWGLGRLISVWSIMDKKINALDLMKSLLCFKLISLVVQLQVRICPLHLLQSSCSVASSPAVCWPAVAAVCVVAAAVGCCSRRRMRTTSITPMRTSWGMRESLFQHSQRELEGRIMEQARWRERTQYSMLLFVWLLFSGGDVVEAGSCLTEASSELMTDCTTVNNTN